MKKCNKELGKKEIIILIFGLIALGILLSDLVLFTTSLKGTGVGRGFSRYWRE